mgnify:CR=1 FL=1
MKQKSRRYDELLRSITQHEARTWKGALIDVLDTAELCSAWFEQHGIQCTAADLVAMTELVMIRQEALVRKERDDD